MENRRRLGIKGVRQSRLLIGHVKHAIIHDVLRARLACFSGKLTCVRKAGRSLVPKKREWNSFSTDLAHGRTLHAAVQMSAAKQAMKHVNWTARCMHR